MLTNAYRKAFTLIATTVARGAIPIGMVNDNAEHLAPDARLLLGQVLLAHNVPGYTHGASQANGAAHTARQQADLGGADGAATPPPGATTDGVNVDLDDLPSEPPPAWQETFQPNGRWGLFDTVYNDILAHSIRPQPPFAVAGSLALLSTLVGNNFLIEDLDGMRLNLFVAIIGPTGSGKGSPQKRIRDLIESVGMLAALLDRIGSYQGLEDKVIADPHRFVCSDEGQKLFAAMADKANHLSGILDTMLQLYSASNGIYIERAIKEDRLSAAAMAKMTAQTAQAAPIGQPAAAPLSGQAGQAAPPKPAFKQELRSVSNPYLTVLLAATLAAIETAMTNRYVEQGFFNRILFFPTDLRRPKPQIVTARPATGFLTNLAAMCAAAKPPVTRIKLAPEVLRVFRNDHVPDMVDSWTRKQRDPDIALNVCARVQENAFRVAGILAVLTWFEQIKTTGEYSNSPPVIGTAEFAYAVQLVWWCSTRFGQFVGETLGDADERSDLARVRRWLRKKGLGPDAGWYKERDITRSLNLKRKFADEVFGDLAATGDIERNQKTNRNGASVNLIRLRGR